MNLTFFITIKLYHSENISIVYKVDIYIFWLFYLKKFLYLVESNSFRRRELLFFLNIPNTVFLFDIRLTLYTDTYVIEATVVILNY